MRFVGNILDSFQRTRERSEGWISLPLLWDSGRVRQGLVLAACQCVSECYITVNKCLTQASYRCLFGHQLQKIEHRVEWPQ